MHWVDRWEGSDTLDGWDECMGCMDGMHGMDGMGWI